MRCGTSTLKSRSIKDRRKTMAVVTATLIPALVNQFLKHTSSNRNKRRRGRPKGTKTIKRQRRPAEDLFSELSDHGFRRMYRMTQNSFWRLYDILLPNMPNPEEHKRGSTPNGDISVATRLAMALRYFCGGDPKDIGLTHGVNNTTEVMKSVWNVVDAVNATSSMDIKFPKSHEEQKRVAEGFRCKSRIGLGNCVGAIDGLLIWIHKPTSTDIKDNIGFGPKKFFCGRKKKYGVNMMGTCDSTGKFLDVEIQFPGSSSDFYAFLNSDLRKKLEQVGFLAEGLCLYGDNAYVNTPYMIVPFKGAQDGAKDAFNFFHSSLRINIECAFGMLVHRWGILRKAIPMNIPVKKITALVMCLCKLHNFCLAQTDNVVCPLPRDVMHIRMQGGFALPRFDGNEEWRMHETDDRVDGLMDGGHHLNDVAHGVRRAERRRANNNDLPYVAMLDVIKEDGYRRPRINNNNYN